MNDKEKIEEAVKYINEIMAWRKTKEAPHGVQSVTFTREKLEEIKNILGKSSSVEKVEKILELIDNFEKEGRYTPLPLIEEIKEVLEK